MKRSIPRAMVCAGVVLSAVACGSSSNSSSPGSSTGTGAAQGSEIRVGIIGAFSGLTAATSGPAKLAIQAWADDVNARGGIKGHPVHLYIEDDKGVSATSVTQIKQLVEQDHVVAIVGEQSTPGDSAWASYVQDKGIPVVGGDALHTPYLSNPNFYAATGNLISAFYGVSALAKEQGPRYGVLYCAELPECAGLSTIMKAFTPTTGVTVNYEGKVAATASDYTAQCQGLKEAGVQSYTAALTFEVIPRVAKQCALQGVKAPVIVSGEADSTTPGQPGADGEQNADIVYPFFDESIPAAKAMHDAFRKYEPTLGTAAAPLNGQGPIATYVSGKLLEAAINAAPDGPITSDSIKQGLYSLKGETLGGLTVPLTYTQGKPFISNCYFTYEIRGTDFAMLNGGKPSCAPQSVIDGVVAKFS